MDLWSLLDRAAARTPEAPALVEADARLDHAGARDAARALAGALQARNVQPGDRVAVLAHNSIAYYLAYFAVDACGAILVALNTRLSVREHGEILQDCTPRLLLHDAAHAQRAIELAHDTGIAAGALQELAAGDPAAGVPRPGGADAVAHLYYTSGTTGRPKGVMLTHRNVATHAAAAVAELALTAADRWAHIAPMFHLADAWATFAITQVGGVHVFLPRFAAGAALDLLADQHITITNLVPTMLNLMVKEPGAADRDYALRMMLSGGAPIAPEVVRRILTTFRCDYVQTYGMTETSPYLTLGLLHPHLRGLSAEERLRIQCKTGRPFRGVELRVVDGDGRPVPADGRHVGEIRVRGATVTPGYWNQPATTAAAFDRDGFLRTGDLATIDAEGYVDIVDRQKDVIKTGGEAVYSVEVENVLYQHPAVLECAVYGAPDPVWGEAVTAAVVLQPGCSVGAAELVDFCRERIAHFKAPRTVRFLVDLPKTGTGKISKRLLRQASSA